jgi:hypothetical protein
MIGLGATSLSAIQSLMQTINSNYAVYQTAYAQAGSSGVCGTNTVAPPGLAALSNALSACQQLGPLLSTLGGYAASYASQMQTTAAIALGVPTTVPGSYDICVEPSYGTAVGNAVTFAQAAYNAALQQVQQAQAATLQSLSIPSGHRGQLTVAVLGWQYTARPVPAQVQGMFAGTGTLSSSLTVSSVTDTGHNDLLGNPLFIANVAASGVFSGSPASRAGVYGGGYSTVLCGTSQWCLGISSFADQTYGTTGTTFTPGFPTVAPAPTVHLPVGTNPPATIVAAPTQPGATPSGATPSGATPSGATPSGAPPLGPSGATPPTGAAPPPTPSPAPGATVPAAGTSSTSKDLIIGAAVTAGLAAVGAGVLWFAHRQHTQQHR